MLPLVPGAGLGGAGATDATHAVSKLLVLETQAAGHTGAGVGPPVRGTHWDEAVRTTTGKTCGVKGHRSNTGGTFTEGRGSSEMEAGKGTSEVAAFRARGLRAETFSPGADGVTSEAGADLTVQPEGGAMAWGQRQGHVSTSDWNLL